LILYKWRQSELTIRVKLARSALFPKCDWNMPRLLAQNAQDPLWIKISSDMTAQRHKNKADL